MKNLLGGCAVVLVCLGLLVVIGALSQASPTAAPATAVPAAKPDATVAAPPAAAPAPAPTIAKPAPTAVPPTAAPPTQAPAAKPTAPPKPEPTMVTLAKMGDRVESGGVALTVNSVQRVDSLGQFFKAKPGRIFLVADVLIESTTREKAPYNPLYFKVKDGDGYEFTGSLMGGDNGLKSGELAAGEKVRGTVPFDVPTASKGIVLSYQPAVLFGGYQTIRVQLE